LNHVSKRVFDDKIHSHTIDTQTLPPKNKLFKPKNQQKRPSKKSVNTTKTMSSSRLKYKAQQRINMSITLDNYKEFNKNEIAEELHHYAKLCLNLRKENCSLQQELHENKRSNKENLVELQRKINKINEKTLNMR
jgi:nicotinic acid mononucleotide adenylyltransferase